MAIPNFYSVNSFFNFKRNHYLLLFIIFSFFTCVSTERNRKDKYYNNYKEERFGVVDSLKRKVQITPDFSSVFEEEDSSIEEEAEKLDFSFIFKDFFEKYKEKEIDIGLLGLFWPTEFTVVTDTFGVRRFTGVHKGVDIRVRDKYSRKMSAIFAAEKGLVVKTKHSRVGYGNRVDIEHRDSDGNVFYTRYAHLSKIYIHRGDTVAKGERIARGGNTGRSRGPHLHFEVFVKEGRKKIEYNPLVFFPDFKDDICFSLPRRRYRGKRRIKHQKIMAIVKTLPDVNAKVITDISTSIPKTDATTSASTDNSSDNKELIEEFMKGI